MILESGLNDRL